MNCQDALIIALTLALVVLLVYQCGGGRPASCGRAAGGAAGAAAAASASAGQSNFGGPPIPAPGLHSGAPKGGASAPAAHGGGATPEQTAEAERELWLASTEAGGAGGFDAERAQDSQAAASQYHDAPPSIDYAGYTKGLVADARMLENHARWVHEMKPWSGVAMRVDDLDEASEASTDFRGLRRPQAPPPQSNPLQVTEKDSSTFAKNPVFRFR